jgi:purine catabolism regulator
MGLPTVREVLRLALPSKTRLVGGEDGLARSVLWARRMSTYPPAFAALEKGEIALLAADAIPLLDERLTLARVVEVLAGEGAAALAVVGEVPRDAGEVAARHNLPLFVLPDAADLRDVERAIIRLIVEREAQLDRRGRQVYRQLAQPSIENRGLPAIAQALHDITAKPVVVQDERLSVLALAWPEDFPLSPDDLASSLEDEAPLRQWLWGQQLDGKAPPCTELDLVPGLTRCVAAIIIEGQLNGYLSLLGPADEVDDLDRLAVERGALVCAGELAKQRAVTAAEDRLRGDLLDLLLTASPAEEPALARRAAEAGYELESYHAAAIFDLEENSPHSLTLLASEFRGCLLHTAIQPFLCPYDKDLVALCRADDADHLRRLEELAEATRARLSQIAPKTHLAIGIGRPGAGLAGLRRSFHQAQEALVLAHTLLGGDGVLLFSDLGLYRLLCQLQDSEELVEFYNRTLGPLVQYDAGHNTELVQTLETFFAHHGNASQTAETLHLHRNSLLYRLERIGEIAGLDLNDADDRFSLQLALKIRPLLTAP